MDNSPGEDHIINFETLFDLEPIQCLQDDFSNAVGLTTTITRPDGTSIKQPSNFCRLCNEIIRKTEKVLANCYTSDF